MISQLQGTRLDTSNNATVGNERKKREEIGGANVAMEGENK